MQKAYVTEGLVVKDACWLRDNWLILFKEVNAVYCDSHTEPMYTNATCGQNTDIKAGVIQKITTGI